MSTRLRLLGSNSSGTFIPPPSDAIQAFGYTTLKFWDHFSSLSTMDTTNSNVAGFKWYGNNSWPNASNLPYNSSPLSNWTTIVGQGGAVVSDPTLLSISNSNLVMAHLAAGTTGRYSRWNTATVSGASYIGNVFSGGAYFECKMQYTPTATTTGWPSFAAWPIDWLTGSASKFTELDFMEAFPASSGLQYATHAWNTVANTDTSDSAQYTGTPDSSFHTYGCLWVPIAKNDGVTGLIKYYYDGSLAHTTTYTSGSTYSFSDSHSYMVSINCGTGAPATTFDYVSVWQ